MALVLGDVQRREVISAHLAEVVQVACDEQPSGLDFGEADALRRALHQTRDERRMPAQARPRVLEERDQNVDRLEVRLAREPAGSSTRGDLDALEVRARDHALAPFGGECGAQALFAHELPLVHVE